MPCVSISRVELQISLILNRSKGVDTDSTNSYTTLNIKTYAKKLNGNVQIKDDFNNLFIVWYTFSKSCYVILVPLCNAAHVLHLLIRQRNTIRSPNIISEIRHRLTYWSNRVHTTATYLTQRGTICSQNSDVFPSTIHDQLITWWCH